MIENNLHKKDFSEADSPIPLIPVDQAWNDMRTQLDDQLPVEKKKRRRFLLWLPPLGCASALMLIIMLAGLSWWFWQRSGKELPGNHSPSYRKNIIPVIPGESVTNKSIPENRPVKIAGTKTQNEGPHTSQVEQVHDNDLYYSMPHIIPNTYIISIPQKPFAVEPKADSTPEKASVFSAGFQWPFQIPIHSPGSYFTGPNGKDQFYRLLIPAAWLSYTKNRHRFTLEIAPFYASLLPSKVYETAPVQLTDSLTIHAQKKLVKGFGSRIGLHYGYQPGPHWQLQGSLYGAMWHKGLIDAVPADSSGYGHFTYPVKMTAGNAMERFQPAAAIGLGYIHHSLEGWLQVEKAFTSPAKGIQPPLSIQLSLRWKMLKTFVNNKRN